MASQNRRRGGGGAGTRHAALPGAKPAGVGSTRATVGQPRFRTANGSGGSSSAIQRNPLPLPRQRPQARTTTTPAGHVSSRTTYGS